MPTSSPFHHTFTKGAAAVAAAVTGALLLALPASAAVVPAPITYLADDAALSLTPLGSYESGVFDESAAEIVAYHAATKRLFVVNALLGAVDVLDVSDATAPKKLFTIAADGVANSVAIRPDGLGIIALESLTKTDPGSLLFFNAGTGAILGSVQVGALPDMVSISEDGTVAVVANEGEPDDDYSVDPEGSVSVVSLPTAVAAPAQEAVRTAGFGVFEEGGSKALRDGVRIFAGIPGSVRPVSEGLEPEYVAIDGGTAYVALQENNAVAVLDLVSAEVTDIRPLGAKDHGLPGNGLDASDRDPEGAPTIDIRTYEGLNGLYLPDGINAYTSGTDTYLVTANEGDAREWGSYEEGARVKDLGEDGLAPVCATSPLAELTGDADLGRLNISTESGLNTEAGCYDELYSFGSRSFSIWTTDGVQVFDSGDDFEQITAAANPEFFNSNHSESNLEGRSDDKGPEPENLAIGEVNGRTYAFIGFERVGGIAVYDITDPTASTFVTYVNNRDFAQSVEDDGNLALAGDLGPEGLAFIPAEGSPTGEPMLAVGNEVSGTTTLFEIGSTVVPDTTTIQVLGINDFHGRIEANGEEAGAAVLAGAVNELRAANPNTFFVSAGDNIGASTFTSFSQEDTPTIDALREAGLDVSAVGNHEFDRGFADLTERVLPGYGGKQFGLGANVYDAATGEPALDEYYVEDIDGVRVGFIGTVTESTPSAVSPAGIEGLEFGSQLEAANRVATQLKDGDDANGEADVLVLLTHDGSETDDCATIATEATTYGELVRGADAGIDAILSGHTHQQYNCSFAVEGWEGRERPVLQSGQYGTTLDQVEIEVNRADATIVSVTSDLLPLTEQVGEENRPLYEADPEVAAIVAAATETAEEAGAVVVGSITADILRGGENGSDRGVESSLGNLVADVQLWATSNGAFGGEPAQIALMNPGGLRADLLYGEDGSVTYREVASVQPFGNTLFTMDLTGAQLKQVLEEQWQPEGSSRSKLHLGVSEGFTYEYDPAAARGEHILSMNFQGEPIADDQVFRVTANSFLAAGGDNFTTLAEGANRADTGQIDLIAAVEYFEKFKVVEPAPLGRAAIAAEPGPTPTPTPTPTPSTPTDQPTDQPTAQPTDQPTDQPSGEPTDQPTDRPTDPPTNQPTDQSTNEPIDQAIAGGGSDGSGYDGGSDGSGNVDGGYVSSGGNLAQTGANVLLIAGAGLVLALLGGVLLLFFRRRGAVDTTTS